MGTEVLLGVAEEGSDAGRLEELALLLRHELLALDVDAVEPATAGEAPAGTRGAVGAVAGALVVSLQPTVQAVGAVVALVRDWLRRSGSERSVRVEIDGDVLELTGATTELQQRLVDDWIAKHAAG
jgi:hypothetical protein